MGGFLQSLRDGFSHGSDPAVVEHFKRLARTRAPLEIEPLQVGATAGGRQFSIVERVDDRSVVIGRPTGPGAHQPLIQFGAYNLLLPSSDGELAGESRVLSRVRIQGGGRRQLHCYRLAMPTSLRPVARQTTQRLLFGGDLMCEARVRAEGRATPIFGDLEELTPTSVRVRCRAPVTLVRGASVHLDATLPPPVGDLQEVGEVVSLQPATKPEHGDRPLLHVKFMEPVAAIKRAINDGLEQRNAA